MDLAALGLGVGEAGVDGIGDGAKVIKKFEGHTDKVKEFVWRTRGGEDMERDDRTFQLITWGKDQSLRFWPIEEKTMLVSLTFFSFSFFFRARTTRLDPFVSSSNSLLSSR